MANERRFAMAAAIGLRGDYDAAALRRLARSAENAGQVRRLLALAAIYAGSSRSEAAAVGGVGLQTVRDWVLRFNAERGQAGWQRARRREKVDALARPMVRTTRWRRRFWAAKTCSTLARTRAWVALPRRIWAGIGWPRGLARWNSGLCPRRSRRRRLALERYAVSAHTPLAKLSTSSRRASWAPSWAAAWVTVKRRTKPCERSMPTWFL